MRCSSARSRSCSTAATWWRRGAGYIRFRGLGASWSPGTRRDDPPAGTSRTRRPTAVRGEGSGPLFLSRRSDLLAWIYLVVAGLFEVAWAIGLMYTVGWTRRWPCWGPLAGVGGGCWFV